MNWRGNSYNNVVTESVFLSLKRDRLGHRTYKSRDEARKNGFGYIEIFHNPFCKQARNEILPAARCERQRILKAEGVWKLAATHIPIALNIAEFQSTPLREGRPASAARREWLATFQSTPLRKGRHVFVADSGIINTFQSTPLREGRRGRAPDHGPDLRFNPRPCVRGDPYCRDPFQR